MPDRCSSCGAEVVWVKTDRGRWMPVDVKPSDHGNLRVDRRHVAHVVTQVERDAYVGPLWTSHFATCPFADEHRSSR